MTVKEQLLKRKRELESFVKHIEPRMLHLPEGNLRIKKKGKGVQYYHITEKGDTIGKYIPIGEKELAKSLAKKDYYNKIITALKREIKAISNYLDATDAISPEEVYGKMSTYRQDLINPVMLTDEEYAKVWEAEEYNSNPYHAEQLIYSTRRGERVRTKSEKMIADMYCEMGVPYKYEYPLRLNNGRVKYPDFTILKLPDRITIYHEHMGLLEDAEYRKGNLIKLREYQDSGIYMGKNLIVTYETEYAPFDIYGIKKMIEQLLY